MIVLDLFSGIGWMSLAAEWAGFKVLAHAEVNPYCRRVLSAHWPDTPNLGDVTKLCRRLYDCELEEYDTAGIAWCPRCDEDFGDCECIGADQFTDEYGRPDVIAAGVPCQPASLIGSRRGTGDERWLWPDVIRVMRELRPGFGLFENPAAILTLESGRAFSGILGELAAIGYDAFWECVPAATVGAGHQRERVWLVAADADGEGLEGYAGNGQDRRHPESHRPTAPPYLLNRKCDRPQWYSESRIQPVVDGISGRVARTKLTAIGNSLVPHVAFMFFSAMARQMEATQ